MAGDLSVGQALAATTRLAVPHELWSEPDRSGCAPRMRTRRTFHPDLRGGRRRANAGVEGTPEQTRIELTTDLDELVREGARRMLAAALEARAATYIAAHAEVSAATATGWCGAAGTRDHIGSGSGRGGNSC